jgi:hypothetical protein
MRVALFLMVACLSGIGGCAAKSQPEESPPQPSHSVAVGGDSDAHGCKASAGYTWCAKENRCVRPWELAKEKGFDVAGDGFKRYCTGGT